MILLLFCRHLRARALLADPRSLFAANLQPKLSVACPEPPEAVSACGLMPLGDGGGRPRVGAQRRIARLVSRGSRRACPVAPFMAVPQLLMYGPKKL